MNQQHIQKYKANNVNQTVQLKNKIQYIKRGQQQQSLLPLHLATSPPLHLSTYPPLHISTLNPQKDKRMLKQLISTKTPKYFISHLYYNKQTQKQLGKFKSSINSGPYNLPLKFIYTQSKTTLWNRIFIDGDLVSRFQYFMEFLSQYSNNLNQMSSNSNQMSSSSTFDINGELNQNKVTDNSSTKADPPSINNPINTNPQANPPLKATPTPAQSQYPNYTISNIQSLIAKYPNIEQNLLFKINSFIKSRPESIIVHQCKVGRAYFIEQKKIYGVFMHRKLNLAKSCYSTEVVPKSGDIKYRIKGKFKSAEDMKDHDRARKLFQEENVSNIYMDTYETFQKTQFITRALVKYIVDLKIEIKVPELEESIRLGYDGPSQHILQIESYKVSRQPEEWMITDADFFCEGNYHFLKQKNY